MAYTLWLAPYGSHLMSHTGFFLFLVFLSRAVLAAGLCAGLFSASAALAQTEAATGEHKPLAPPAAKPATEERASHASGPLTAADKALLGRINRYLSGLTHLEGDFTQIDPQGRYSRGRFYMRRPGRARFEYAPPDSLLVVADGTWLIVQEKGEGPAQRYPLSQTPLEIILAPDGVDLERNMTIASLTRDNGLVFVTLSDPQSPEAGTVTLVFDDQITALRQWVVTDARNQRTSVALSGLVAGAPADHALFTVDESGGRLDRFRRP